MMKITADNNILNVSRNEDKPKWQDSLVLDADKLLKKLFPICRSITGNGVRETLSILKEIVDFDIKEIPSGTGVYDWTVPPEWNVFDAYIIDSHGKKIIDFKKNNLHLVSYSIPINETMSFAKLDKHLHTLPDLPEAIPYRTTYYNENWGFCLSHKQYLQLDRDQEYKVFIGSTLKAGKLSYGEKILRGSSDSEYLISTYCCHPSLANDNLSGVVLWALLLRELSARKLQNSYRFLIIPETIGAIAYLARNESDMKKVRGGLIPTTVAGPGKFGYKQTFLGDHEIDRVVKKTFVEYGIDFILYAFDINGSDETHYSAPAFRIPVGTICKDKYYEYDFYHTSFDNLDYINASNLIETMKLYVRSIEKLEMNRVYRSEMPYCEPMLSRRNLYPKTGGHVKQKAANYDINHHKRKYEVSDNDIFYGSELDAIGWLMFFGDGKHSILDIAEKTALPVKQLFETAEKLCAHGLLKPLLRKE